MDGLHVAESSGEKVLAAREEQGRVLIVIPYDALSKLPHADWLNHAQRVNVKAAARKSFSLSIYIMVSCAVRCMLMIYHILPSSLFNPLCLAGGHLAQLSRAARAEYRHDAKAAVE